MSWIFAVTFSMVSLDLDGVVGLDQQMAERTAAERSARVRLVVKLLQRRSNTVRLEEYLPASVANLGVPAQYARPLYKKGLFYHLVIIHRLPRHPADLESTRLEIVDRSLTSDPDRLEEGLPCPGSLP